MSTVLVNGSEVAPAELVLVLAPARERVELQVPGYRVLSSWADGTGTLTVRYERLPCLCHYEERGDGESGPSLHVDAVPECYWHGTEAYPEAWAEGAAACEAYDQARLAHYRAHSRRVLPGCQDGGVHERNARTWLAEEDAAEAAAYEAYQREGR